MISIKQIQSIFIISLVLCTSASLATEAVKAKKQESKIQTQVENKKTRTRKLASKSEELVLDVYVKLSEDVTQFTTTQQGSKYKMTLSHPIRTGVYVFDQSDLNYLYKLLAEITTPSNDIKQCAGNFVRVRAKNFDKVGCLTSKTPTATKLKDFANLLSKVF